MRAASASWALRSRTLVRASSSAIAVRLFSSEGRDQQVEDVLQDSDLGGLCSELCLGVVVVLSLSDRHRGFDCDLGVVEYRCDGSTC